MPHFAVAPFGDMQQIVLLFRRQKGAVIDLEISSPVPTNCPYTIERVHHHSAVSVKHGYFHVTERLLQESVLHTYPHLSLLRMERKG